MNNNNTDGGHLFIPYETVESHIQCSVCLNVIRGCVLTPCGHRFCNRCITEWVQRTPRCPCCNGALTSSQFYCDVQFDGMVDDLLRERDKAEDMCLNRLLNQVEESSGSMATSDLEEVLKKHLKRQLSSFKNYFDRLKRDHDHKIKELERQTDENKNHLKEEMEKNLAESEKLAAEAFDKYLTNNVPGLEIIPVSISIYLVDKNVRLNDVVVHPLDCLSALKPLIEGAMAAQFDPVISWQDDGGIQLLFGPLSKSSSYNIPEIIPQLSVLPGVHKLSWNSRPVVELQMLPGSELVLQGVFKAESDFPARCYVDIFRESGTQNVDYFMCNTCSTKWICKSCAHFCHKGHSISPFVLGHTPTWACCYCHKKTQCKLLSK